MYTLPQLQFIGLPKKVYLKGERAKLLYYQNLTKMEESHPQPQAMKDQSEEVPPPSPQQQSEPSLQAQSKEPVPTGEAASLLGQRKEGFMKGQDIKGRIMCDMDFYFKQEIYRKIRFDFFNTYSVVGKEHPSRIKYSELLSAMSKNQAFDPTLLGLSREEERGTAAVLGMAVADALGASTQFDHFTKKGLGVIKEGFSDIKVGRHGKIGIWTDDASMGFSMADSLLLHGLHFDPTHFRFLFTLWLRHGLNNGGRPRSIGLGGNISISMDEFMYHQQPYTATEDQFNNGNGSLMRLAPLPVAFSNQPEKAVALSALQSLTTHNGVEAAECCRLMASILVTLINRPKGKNGKEALAEACANFQSKVESVRCLARSECEPEELYLREKSNNRKFKSFNKSVQDRNWNWKEEGFTYAPTRLHQQPGYIGSYCMDALAMALHTVWFSTSCKQVIIQNADMGGDCDTVGSIAGQIAGALYGLEPGLLELYSEMADFREGKFEAFLKGYLLSSKTPL